MAPQETRRMNAPEPYIPRPIGWNPSGTYTGRMAPKPAAADRWDSAPSRNPYPPAMPDLGAQGAPEKSIHLRAMRMYEKFVHERGVRMAGGEPGLLRELQVDILRRRAVREELGTGVVLFTPEEERILAMGDGDAEALA